MSKKLIFKCYEKDIFIQFLFVLNFFHRIILPSAEVIHMAEVIASKLDRFFQQPYSDELRCFSDASKVPLGDIILANVFYELTAHANSSLKYVEVIYIFSHQKILTLFFVLLSVVKFKTLHN